MNKVSVWRRRLVIFAKEPKLGAVKSRLAGDLGWVEATRWYRAACRTAIGRLAGDPRWRTYLAVTPDDLAIDLAFGVTFPQNVPRLAQGGGDLGKRMERFLRSMPPGPVVIVGTDIPALRADHIEEAYRRLGQADFVFGPATDGGFWLVGAKRIRPLPDLFANVRWSTRHALADAIENLRGARVAYAATLSDVDEAADLREIRSK